jgi:hypothetical protein
MQRMRVGRVARLDQRAAVEPEPGRIEAVDPRQHREAAEAERGRHAGRRASRRGEHRHARAFCGWSASSPLRFLRSAT